MYYLYGITLIILGLLAVPSLLANKPSAKELLNKIVPYQGWIGIVFFVWGAFGLIQCILNFYASVFWVFWLLSQICEVGLGFLLGYGLIAKYALANNEAAKAKGEAILAKLLPWQGRLGLLAIVLGIIYTVLVILR